MRKKYKIKKNYFRAFFHRNVALQIENKNGNLNDFSENIPKVLNVWI